MTEQTLTAETLTANHVERTIKDASRVRVTTSPEQREALTAHYAPLCAALIEKRAAWGKPIYDIKYTDNEIYKQSERAVGRIYGFC